MRFTLQEVTEITASALELDHRRMSAVRARIQHFQKLPEGGFPSGVQGIGAGSRANYDCEKVFKVVLGFELLDLGFTPERMRLTVENSWSSVRSSIGAAAINRSEAEYLATYPSALEALRQDAVDARERKADPPPSHAATHTGSLPQLNMLFTTGRRPADATNFLAVNLTGMLTRVEGAVAALLGSLPTERRRTVEHFADIVSRWAEEDV